MSTTITEAFEPLIRLQKDIKAAAATLGRDEARFLVDAYYAMQGNRIRANNQIRSLAESKEPHAVLAWLSANSAMLERNVRAALAVYSQASPVGQWAESITGIGPVLSAGLLAHVEIERAPTVGHIWRFAGLDPTVQWERAHKRPWNASLKTLCWKIGESFVKVSNLESDVYGHLWRERKEAETAKNEAGQFTAQATQALERKNYGKVTDAYKAYSAGKLPPAHIHARAKRYAVKLFLAHWHWVAYESRYGEPPPKPYAIEHLGHVHLLTPPNWGQRKEEEGIS